MTKALVGNVIQIINFGVSIAIIVLLAKIYNDTENDPLKIYQLEISSDFLENTDPLIPGGGGSNRAKMSRKGPHAEYIEFNKTLSYYNIKKESSIDLNLKFKNITRINLRNLDSICDLKNDIENKGFTTFDLGFDQVHKMALGIIIIYCCILGSGIIIILAVICNAICGDKGAAVFIACLPIAIIVIAFSGIVNLVLFIIMMVNYYKGNTTGEFLDYYEDCLEDDEKTEEIKNIYDKLNNLHKCFTAFVCLNFIGIFLNALGSCFKEKK